ncbi:MAG: flavodoxin family protein [Acidobacteriaceae bacterium]
MTVKLLILKGSPREKGNSAALAERAAAGARQAGAQVTSIYLHGLDIRPCDGCDLCIEEGVPCVIEDDMQSLYPKLLEADALLLASPIYWFTYSAQLKLCIDRWYGLWNKHPKAFRGKPVGIILTYGDSDLYTSGGINAIHTFETTFRFLQAPIAGLVYGSASDPGDIDKQPELMQAAYELGSKLAMPQTPV